MASSFPNIIACAVEMFSENMQVFVFKNGIIQNVTIPGEEAAELLVRLCHEQDVYTLKLSGDETYLEDFISTIRDAEEVNYSERDRIHIQVVGQEPEII